MVAKLLAVAFAIYAGLAIALFAFQRRLVYFPTRELAATPAAIGLAYEDVRLAAADGVRLHGWWLPQRDGAPVVLFFHGNAGNVSDRLETLAIYARLGFGALAIDYRGYGESEGSPGEAGTYLDARAAWEHLVATRAVRPERIVIHGRSLGGAVAANLAARERPAGLILESTFTSVPDLAAELYPLFPIRLMARIHYDTRAALATVRCPVLVAHGRPDETVPFRHGRALFEAVLGERRFLELDGRHADGFLASGPRYAQAIGTFARESAGRAASEPAGRE